MPPALKRSLVFVACVLFAWYAHVPLLGAGFLGSDAAVLDDIDRAFEGGGIDAAWSVDALEHRPLAAASLALSRSLHARGGVYTPGDAGRLRLESLLILVIAAFGVRYAVIRAMRPWTGEDHARAAGAASGAFLMVHPLLVPVVAHLPARGDVVALAASAWSVAFLLRGRQERRAWQLALAFVLALVAAASSPTALLLVPLGFGLEFVAAHRHRPIATRLRTAVQVALGYGAALGLEALVRLGMRPSAGADAPTSPLDPEALLLGEPTGLAHSLAVAAEKTGVVVLPVNTTGVGTVGYALAVLALLAALHPGFVAARAAPRLWGRLLGGWAVALVVLLALGARERTIPASLADAPGTLSLAVCMAVGLGTSASALSGARRTVLPFLAGGLYAMLTTGSGATIQEAAAQVGALHQSILDAARENEWSGAIVALDPPREVAGVRALSPEDDASLGSAPFVPRDSQPFPVLGIESESFWAVATEPWFRDLREQGVTVLLPPDPPDDANAPVASIDKSLDRVARGVVRPVVSLPAPRPATSLGDHGEFGWVGEGVAPAGRRFDPFDAAAIVAIPPPLAPDGAPASTDSLVRWTGSSELDVDASSRGVRVEGEGPEGEVAFDVGVELDWLLAGEVRSLWFTGDLRRASAVRVLRTPPSMPHGVTPRVVGDDWTFDVSGAGRLKPLGAAKEEWVLWVVDPKSGESIQLAPRGAETGRLTVDGAAIFHDRDVLWILDRRLGGVTVERARGRRGR
ncbi:MAG: hypothetical protein AAGA20_21235 [Planctomycetota bacterium]